MAGACTVIPEIKDGWIKGVEIIPSPNFNHRPNGEISLLIIHNISLPPKQFGGNYVESFFTNRLPVEEHPYFKEIVDLTVSSHLYVKRTGAVVQFVSLNERAWHAGKSFFNGREACNDFSIGIELEVADDIPYTDEQYRSLKFLTMAIMREYPKITKDRIVGHEHVAPVRKTDPGVAFDWKRYLSDI